MRYIKYLPFILICLILLCAFGCGSKHHSDNDFKYTWRSDTIQNDVFHYLPGTCIMDSDLFVFAAKLSEIDKIYCDTATNIGKYTDWYAKTSSFFNSKFHVRNIDENLCFKHIIGSMIPSIMEFGNSCTASIGEITWLKFGIDLYSMFSVQNTITQKSKKVLRYKWETENEAWLLFISKLFPLIESEWDDVTGTAAVYYVPTTFSKIIQSRTETLLENLVNTNSTQEKSLDRLSELITNINIQHWDYDRNILIVDSVQDSNKKSALQALVKWVEIRSDLAESVNDKRSFNNSTISLLDSISSIIYHLSY